MRWLTHTNQYQTNPRLWITHRHIDPSFHLLLPYLSPNPRATKRTTRSAVRRRGRSVRFSRLRMALRLWASSTANALKISTSVTRISPLLPFNISRLFSSTVLDGLKYASSHEWVKHEGPVATIGITDHAQDHLGEVVFVELPECGSSVSQGGSFGAVESVKATSDVNCPIGGEVIEVNSKLTETPGLINSSPYEDGWMIKVKPSNPSDLDSLMGPKEYTKFCEEEDASH